MLTDALIILTLIFANGLFAGAEIAIIALRKTRLAELVEAGSRRARAVQALRDNPERFLATVQTGITVISAAAAAYGGDVFASELAPLVARVPWLASHARQISLASFILVVSYLSLVLGELVPKSLALRAAEPYALVAGGPLLYLSHITRPFVWVLTRSSNLVLSLFGDRTSFSESRLSPDEIQEMVDEAAKVGSLDQRTSEIASRALDFRNLTAASVMVPRSEIVAVSRGATADELRQVLGEKVYTRLPVYDGPLDNLIGYISIKDLLGPALRGEAILIDKLLRPIHFVPGNSKAAGVLQELQGRRTSIAIVVDEMGGIMGLVTMEDLVEEVVGDVFSEHDRTPDLICRQPDGTVLVQGVVPIHEVNRELDLELPEGPGYSTIAGLCIMLAGRIPPPASRYTTEDGDVLEVLDASPRRVRSVRIHPPSTGTVDAKDAKAAEDAEDTAPAAAGATGPAGSADTPS